MNKKIISLILSASLLLMLSACNSEPVQTNNGTNSSKKITVEKSTEDATKTNENDESIGATPSIKNEGHVAESETSSTATSTTIMESTVTKKSIIESKPVSQDMSEAKEDAKTDIAKKDPTTSIKENHNSTTETTSKNDTSQSTETVKTYDKFEKSIGVYESKNLPSESDYYEDRCPTWIEVYSVGQNVDMEAEIKEKFKAAFGYDANEKVNCSYVGEYLVDGYDVAQQVYQYTIKDLTYPLLQDEFYVIKKKLCTDGSPWVGFVVPGSLDTMDTSFRVTKLLNEMNQQFSDWSGYSLEYMRENKDKFYINMISQAGMMRTKDGQVLEVVYRYTRGINMPLLNQ